MASVATTLSVEDHRQGGPGLRSADRPTPINDICIVDEDGNDCPPGMPREIVVRGPQTVLGYWNKPDETANTLRDALGAHWRCCLHRQTRLIFIISRIKDMIVTGGENVFTPEVENAVIAQGSVQDVAVIGIPHDE